MTLQELDERAMETIVDFFYSGEIEISENNVQDLLPVTCLLQVQSVQEACCEFLKRQLSSENCLGEFSQQFKLVHAVYICRLMKSCEEVDRHYQLQCSV